MDCKQATLRLCGQLADLLHRLEPAAYAAPLAVFSGATLGQHFRHIADFYDCLLRGLAPGCIDYGRRERSPSLQTDPARAAAFFAHLPARLAPVSVADPVEVVADFSADCEAGRCTVQSTLGRELMFAHDHALHHLALIKIGLRAACPELRLDPALGVAPATLRHQRATVADQ